MVYREPEDPREPRDRTPPPPPPLPDDPGGGELIEPPGGETQPPPLPSGGGSGGGSDADEDVLPSDEIGDIPPPPVPRPPRRPRIPGPGVAGIPGTEGGTFAQPGTRAAIPFRTSAFAAQRPMRFGPGAPMVGGGGGVGGQGLGVGGGLSPEEAAELLRALAAGRGQPPQQ
jgi:hypothetical protein